MSENHIYKIPAINMFRLEQEIAKLNRRADKLGVEHIKINIVGTSKEIHKSDFGFEFDYLINHCVVEGEIITLKGWKLVAVLEQQSNKEMLVRELPGKICPVVYRNANTAQCDHCGLKRRRSKLYILQNGDDYKQVGKSCLSDFLNQKDLDSLFFKAEQLLSIGSIAQEAQEENWGSSSDLCVPLEKFVIVCAMLIRCFGWVSKSTSYENNGSGSTCSLAWELCTKINKSTYEELLKNKNAVFKQEDFELAKKAINWAVNIDASVSDNYLFGLGVCCRQQAVRISSSGFVASVIKAYEKNNQGTDEKSSKQLKHVGNIGDRIQLNNLKIDHMTNIDGQYPKTLVKFLDEEGNILTWFASGFPDWLEVNKIINATVTISKHDMYRNMPQTVIKRVVPKF